jgi:hypothetical protein
MNTAARTNNIKKLLEYHLKSLQESQSGRLNMDLGEGYMDVLNRIAIIEGTSKTKIVKEALDRLAEEYGEQVLFPEVGREAS